MASRIFGGVRFVAYPQDHEPRHIHAIVGGGEVIVELSHGVVTIADRSDAIRRASASAVRRVLRLAAGHFDELVVLWNSMHE